MRRLLGPLSALVLSTVLLAGCGTDDTPTASDPAPSSSDPTMDPTTDPTTGPTTDPTKSAPLDPGTPFDLVEIVSETAGGGATSESAVPVGTDAELAAFVAPFSDQLAAGVQQAVSTAAALSGQELYAAVVGLGCDVPPDVEVTPTAGGYTITGTKVADPMQECFAPVTSVAVVAIG